MKVKPPGSGSPHGHLHFGNGSSHKSDVLTPAFPLLDLGKRAWVSDFHIQAPNVKIDANMKTLIERESEKLAAKSFKYQSKKSVDWSLEAIMNTEDGPRNEGKRKLIRDGKSATISEVSKAINASSLDHTSKYLLSSEPIYVYALSFAIYFEKVHDADGINDRVVVATAKKIKSYFNKVLALEIIKSKHLELSPAQKEKILHEAAATNISYVKGQPTSAINRIISRYLDYGKLHTLVDHFFASGEIDPDKGTPQVRQLMVNYLADIGLTVPDEDLVDEEEPDIDFRDDFPEGTLERLGDEGNEDR